MSSGQRPSGGGIPQRGWARLRRPAGSAAACARSRAWRRRLLAPATAADEMSFAGARCSGQALSACGPRGDSVVQKLVQPGQQWRRAGVLTLSPTPTRWPSFASAVRENQRAWARLRQLGQPAWRCPQPVGDRATCAMCAGKRSTKSLWRPDRARAAAAQAASRIVARTWRTSIVISGQLARGRSPSVGVEGDERAKTPSGIRRQRGRAATSSARPPDPECEDQQPLCHQRQNGFGSQLKLDRRPTRAFVSERSSRRSRSGQRAPQFHWRDRARRKIARAGLLGGRCSSPSDDQHPDTHLTAQAVLQHARLARFDFQGTPAPRRARLAPLRRER